MANLEILFSVNYVYQSLIISEFMEKNFAFQKLRFLPQHIGTY
jgi:hypothetical protein